MMITLNDHNHSEPAGAKNDLPTWASRLRGSFLPVIRERGERYARERRVHINSATEDKIAATVEGTISYNVELFVTDKEASRDRISTYCDCPFFRQGFPCKHIWAAILEADRILSIKRAEAGEGSAARDTLADQGGPDRNWRNLLVPELLGKDKENEKDSGSGNFIPVYKLMVEEHGVILSVVEKYVKKDGTLGRKRKISYASTVRASLPRSDRILLALAGDIGRGNARYSYYGSNGINYEEIQLNQKEDLELLLPLLADSGRCTVTHWRKGVVADPLTRGVPFKATFRLKASEDEIEKDNQPEKSTKSAETNKKKSEVLKIHPVFCIDGIEPLSQEHEENGEKCIDITGENMDCIFNTEPVMFIADGRLYQAEGVPFSLINQLYPLKFLEVPASEVREFVQQSDTLSHAPEIELPDNLSPELLDYVEPKPVLIVEFQDEQVLATLVVDYEGLEIDWLDRRTSILDPDRWVRIPRDVQKEQSFVKLLERHGFRQENNRFVRDVKQISTALNALGDKGFRLEAINRKKLHTGAGTGFKIRSGVDWFDLEGHISFGDDIIPLPRAIRDFMKGNRTVTLKDGSVGILPGEWMEDNAPLLEMALQHGSKGKKGAGKTGLRFPSSRALLVDALLAEAQDVSIDRDFEKLRHALKNFSGIETPPVPVQFKGTLRSYQREALGWFNFLKKFRFGGILADDMGLGKTVQVLAWLSRLVPTSEKHKDTKENIHQESPDVRPSLIVVPTSLVFNWKAEAGRFVPDMKVMVYGGTERDTLLEKLHEYHLVITTYGLLRRDIEKLSKIEFQYVILDESQAIKNPMSLTSKAARLLKASHRLCLTGTPLENNVGELWSQMEFLNPGILGNRAVFERNFLKPIERNDEKALETLKTIVKPFILRRTKELVASELPEKMEQTVFCAMPPEQIEIYARLRDHYRSAILTSVQKKGMGKSKIKVLEALLRLRQAANHPALVGHPDAPSGKFSELMMLVEEAVAGGHKALIFSQFTRMLRLITEYLDTTGITYEYLDGGVPQKKREQRVANFQQNDDVKLFLISLKAGGVGLNLTAADYVFIVDPWWNPAVELQAVDRTHRIGQDKRVFTYRFITVDTVEEKVLALQKQKQELVTSILSGSGDMLKNLSSEDLEVLFS